MAPAEADAGTVRPLVEDARQAPGVAPLGLVGELLGDPVEAALGVEVNDRIETRIVRRLTTPERDEVSHR
jgi:hypothetical protein